MNTIREKKKKSTIYVIALGGTIASSLGNKTSEFYSSPSTEIHDLILNIPIDKTKINIESEQFIQKKSQDITENDLLILANRIQELVDHDEIKGVVVTQGTNCIEEIAYFISLVVNTTKTIVFTGAFRPYNSLGYDGARNLYNAIMIANNNVISHMGVVLTFNDSIVSARYAIKSNPSMLNDFSLNELGVLGQIQGENIYINGTNKSRHTYSSEFNISNIENFPKVCIIYGHFGMESVFIDAAISNNFRGIISAGMGKGYQSEYITQALIRAAQNDIYVVRCSRTGQGVVNVDDKLDLQNGFIAGRSLSPQKARILLSVAICNINNKKEMQRIFDQY